MATTTAGTRERPTKQSKARPQDQTTRSEEEVRILAYQLYERRSTGGADGDPISDWVEAERLLGK
jgi:hypothetical protein